MKVQRRPTEETCHLTWGQPKRKKGVEVFDRYNILVLGS